MAITDLDEALGMIYRNGSGAVWFTDYDGSDAFVSGSLDDIQDENNDPDEIGFFTIRTGRGDGKLTDVPFNGFQELVECPVGTPV